MTILSFFTLNFLLYFLAGLSKHVDHQGWPTTKNALKPSPKNGNLDQNINDSKISYLEFFFWKYSFGHTKFLYLPRRSSGYNQSFFNFRFSRFSKISKPTKSCKKDHTHVLQYGFAQKHLTHFTNISALDIESNILQHNLSDFTNFTNMFLFGVGTNICTAPFLDTQELHSWSTLKENVCIFLYISLRRGKVLSGKGGDWIISLRWLAVWAL